jgi:hypothetical protein
MPSRNESIRARERLQLEAPLFEDANLFKLQQQAADYVREAKRRDASEPELLVSTVLDAVARAYFRYAVRKQRRHP